MILGQWSMFQSTRPAGGATLRGGCTFRPQRVSIHAPRGGRDRRRFRMCRSGCLFQSTRPAGGATTVTVIGLALVSVFQSTRPAGGATSNDTDGWSNGIVSIHAPRGGRDLKFKQKRKGRLNVSIHAPRGGRDGDQPDVLQWDPRVSIHAPRGGRDYATLSTGGPVRSFQSTRPAGGATTGSR